MTIRLDDADIELLKKPDVKPTPRAPGYWRCVHRLAERPILLPKPGCDCREIEPGVWLDCTRYFAEEIADERGRAEADIINASWRGLALRTLGIDLAVYLRAEYFPDYPKGGA